MVKHHDWGLGSKVLGSRQGGKFAEKTNPASSRLDESRQESGEYLASAEPGVIIIRGHFMTGQIGSNQFIEH